MKILGDFNKISTELRKECIPVLKKGEVRKFRMLTGVVNIDPDLTERAKQPVFYGAYQIRTWDRIFDPYLKNDRDEKGGYVDIGVIEEFDIKSNQPTKFRLFVAGQGTGVFTLYGGKIKDEELFEFLCICNENGSFKYRDESITALFEEIDEEAEVMKEAEFADAIVEASMVFNELTDEAIKTIAKRIDSFSLNHQLMTAKIKQYATSNPKEFLSVVDTIPKKGRKPKEKELVES